MVIKHCVGAVLYEIDKGRIFLMQSNKFIDPFTKDLYWIIYGGRIEHERQETEEDALRREAQEELNIEIADLTKIDGNYTYDPERIFYKQGITFLFETYAARMLSTDINPNGEIRGWRLFYREETDNILLLPSTQRVLNMFYSDHKFKGLWK